MTITNEDVSRVATLSKLSFKESDLEVMTHQLGQMIDMMETLNQVDTTGVLFTSNVTEELNVLREDNSIPGESREALLSNVPEKENGYIKVPAIMDNGEAGA